MNRSAQDRLFQKRQRVLSKEDLIGLSPQQREFAEEQFRLIYAQQMSRVTADMTHKKKIQENLNTLDQIESKTLKQQYDKLKVKMQSIEENRSKKLEQKLKNYKQNDERWFHKLKQIQNKFKQQNREAIQKAKKYREQSQNYWKSKEKKMQDVSKTNFQNSRTIKHEADSLHRSFIVEKTNNNRKYKELSMNQKLTINQEIEQKSFRENLMSKPEIDAQIRIHKQKSEILKKQRETLMFQKALEKMDKIEQKRAKVIKEKEAKVSEPTKPKVVDHSHASLKQKSKPRHHGGLSSLNRDGKSKQSLEKLIKDHLEIKQRLQEQQFMQRGQILENSIQKNRKDRILRMIKSKVHDIKVSTLMKEGSKNNLLS